MLFFRKFENLHILLWLIKDLCWLVEWKMIGILMILPTFLVGVWLTWKTRDIREELIHNIAVVLWIAANANWMIAEFYFDDWNKTWSGYLFVAGLFTLAFHYVPLFFRKLT